MFFLGGKYLSLAFLLFPIDRPCWRTSRLLMAFVTFPPVLRAWFPPFLRMLLRLCTSRSYRDYNSGLYPYDPSQSTETALSSPKGQESLTIAVRPPRFQTVKASHHPSIFQLPQQLERTMNQDPKKKRNPGYISTTTNPFFPF